MSKIPQRDGRYAMHVRDSFGLPVGVSPELYHVLRHDAGMDDAAIEAYVRGIMDAPRLDQRHPPLSRFSSGRTRCTCRAPS